MKPLVSIVDYGMGNLFSIKCALDKVGINSKITRNVEIINSSKVIIIPGVGSFPNAMKRMKKYKLDKAIKDYHSKNKIIFGICLGMQLLFDTSYEGKNCKGLGLIRGNVVKFKKSKLSNKSFNVGWKKIIREKDVSQSLIRGEDNYMYFIHSYHVKPSNLSIVTSKSIFNGQKFVSSIKSKNIYGFQFHPEKSSKMGLDIYKCLKKII